MAMSGFDPLDWDNICQREVERASMYSGLSHEVYVYLFSTAIDEKLQCIPEEYHQTAIQHAKLFDYEPSHKNHKNRK